MQPAGLETLFQNLGPTTASMFAGEREGLAQQQALLENMAKQQAYQQAQEMNPLLLKAKQADIVGTEAENRKRLVDAALAEATQQNKIEGSNLDLEEKKRQNTLSRMQTMASKLNYLVPNLNMYGSAAPAVVRDALVEGGMDPNNPKDNQFINNVMRLPPQQMAAKLGQLQQHLITTSEKYVTEMAKAKEHSRSQENAARIGAASREAAAAARNKGTQTIEDLVKSGKMTAEKAAVSLYGASQFEQDPMERQRLLTMAQTYEQFAMQQRQATQAGKPDVGQIANLPTTQLPPSMGGGPKLGTKENPIKLD